MATYIALLRGINVSGQKKIKMADLKEAFESLKFKNVITYIQSGNIVFDTDEVEAIILRDRMEQLIMDRFGFEVECCVLEPSHLNNIIQANPFYSDRGREKAKMYFVFLIDQPAKDRIEKLRGYDFGPEEFSVQENCIFLYVPNGYGKSKMNNNFFEKKLNVSATTRNLKTVLTLLEMTEQG